MAKAKITAIDPADVRPIFEIAREIKTLWSKPYFGAVPYLDAMTQLETINDEYGMEDAETMVLYFLSNAKTFRGEDARRIKAELQGMILAKKEGKL